LHSVESHLKYEVCAFILSRRWFLPFSAAIECWS